MSAPVLVLMPDAEARVDLARPVLGTTPAVRLADAARRAGFAEVLLAPGTCSIVHGARVVSSGEPIAAPALLVFESAVIAEPLLRALAEHPLAADEGYSLGDGLGRSECVVYRSPRVRAGRAADRGGVAVAGRSRARRSRALRVWRRSGAARGGDLERSRRRCRGRRERVGVAARDRESLGRRRSSAGTDSSSRRR
ncbi:hypothetical protein [Nannocystis pusilla]|uniref:hypothetical protein n=1 Tax=Nannocystis pusilla TaxID=889268 RepID=UPI003DA61CC5